MAVAQPIRSKSHIRAIAGYFLMRREYRNHALILLGIHTALRISDLLRLRWEDVFDFRAGKFREMFEVVEGKTKKSKIIALNKTAVRALALLAGDAPKPEGFLFENSKTGKAISRVQAYRIIRAAAEALRLPFRVSCHSLRKTFGYHAWKSDVSPAVIMDIYNHSSLRVTRRYLGITQDDRNAVYLNLILIPAVP